jgi:hypothetical protein
MDKQRYYKIMFIICGSWDLALAVIFSILAPVVSTFFPFFGMIAPQNFLWFYFYMVYLSISGVSFLLMSLDITKNHMVVSMGLIAKIVIFINLLVFFLLGYCNWIFFILGAIQLVEVALFLEFYINYPKLNL